MENLHQKNDNLDDWSVVYIYQPTCNHIIHYQLLRYSLYKWKDIIKSDKITIYTKDPCEITHLTTEYGINIMKSMIESNRKFIEIVDSKFIVMNENSHLSVSKEKLCSYLAECSGKLFYKTGDYDGPCIIAGKESIGLIKSSIFMSYEPGVLYNSVWEILDQGNFIQDPKTPWLSNIDWKLHSIHQESHNIELHGNKDYIFYPHLDLYPTQSIGDLCYNTNGFSKNFLSNQQFHTRFENEMHGVFVPKRESNSYIPKIIHQIWIRDSLMPKAFCHMWRSILRDGWEYYLWNLESINPIIGRWESQFNSTNIQTKEHIARYAIMEKMGGICIDVNSTPVSLFPEWILKCDMFVCFKNEKKSTDIAQYIIGASSSAKSIFDNIFEKGIDVTIKNSSDIRIYPSYLFNPLQESGAKIYQHEWFKRHATLKYHSNIADLSIKSLPKETKKIPQINKNVEKINEKGSNKYISVPKIVHKNKYFT